MKRLIALLIVIVVFFVGIMIWWNHGIAPVNSNDTTQKAFIISPGTGVRELANSLKKEGLIRDPVVFFLLVKKLRLDTKIQAGGFYLSPAQSAEEIAKSLLTGASLSDRRVFFREGLRAEEVGDVLRTSNFEHFDSSWISALREHEGYLFPDTYDIPKSATLEEIITKLTETFDEKYSKEIVPNPNNSFTKEQIVTIASLIEREAKHDEDRSLIASVFYNRLQLGMPLQVDATIQYALGYQQETKTWWKKDLTLDDLDIISPFNTYKNTGLPPHPIANPGIAALKAAMHPATTEYLYYITDKSGVNHYAKTLKEHNANISKYGV